MGEFALAKNIDSGKIWKKQPGNFWNSWRLQQSDSNVTTKRELIRINELYI